MTLATAEQMAALTVPATLPGVVRMGTPVRIVDASRTYWRDHEGKVGVYLGPTGIDGLIHGRQVPGAYVWMVNDFVNESAALDGLAVDLTDATGRVHVVWGVAASLNMRKPCEVIMEFKYWSVQGDCDRLNVEIETIDHVEEVTCSALDALDPSDDTRLPDGSRLVDALALKAVAMHVLGGGR